MKTVYRWGWLGLLVGALTACNSGKKEVAVMKTSAGEMVIEFWPDVAPKTVNNFKSLARQGFYDGTAFHRLVPGFIIQGGDPLSKTNNHPAVGTGGPGYAVDAEFSSRPYVRGVISMARSQQNTNSNGSQFFICLGEAKDLEGKFTAFGKLLKGEEVLAKMEKTPVGFGNNNEMSRPLVRLGVESVKIVPADAMAK